MNKIFAVDAGKHTTKAKGENGLLTFSTKYTKVTGTRNIGLEGATYRVQMDGEQYIIGDMGEDRDYGVEKQSLLHKMAVYTAIAKLGGREDVKLALGCPNSIYMSKDNRIAYKEYMMKEPDNFKLDDVTIKLNLEKVIILPEASGIVYIEPERFKDNRVAVIDLGGRNMNFAIYSNLIPEMSSMFTSNMGSMEIETLVKKEFETAYKTSLHNADVQQIIAQEGIKYRGVVQGREILQAIYEEYLDKILSSITKANFNLDTMDVVFTGGTSILIQDAIQQRIPHASTRPDAQIDNVKGFYEIARRKFNG